MLGKTGRGCVGGLLHEAEPLKEEEEGDVNTSNGYSNEVLFDIVIKSMANDTNHIQFIIIMA